MDTTTTTTAEREYFDTSNANRELIGRLINRLERTPSQFAADDFGIVHFPDSGTTCNWPCNLPGLVLCELDTELHHNASTWAVTRIAAAELRLPFPILSLMSLPIWPHQWTEGKHQTATARIASDCLRSILDGRLPFVDI